MNIAVFNTLYYPNKRGGAEVSVQNICEELAKQHKVTVVSLWDGKSPVISNKNGVHLRKWRCFNLYSVFNYDKLNPHFFKKMVWQIIDLFNFVVFVKALCFFRNNRFDVIWSNNLSGFSLAVWCAAKIYRIPVVHTARDYYLLSNNVQLFNEEQGAIEASGVISWLKKKLLMLTGSSVSSFVGISQYILEAHALASPSLGANRHVIYNSVVLRRDSKKASLAFDKSGKTLRDENVFGYLGQMNSAKGVPMLLEVFQKHSTKATLLLAGNAPDDLVGEYQKDNIVFLGFVEPTNFFEKIDYLIVPSQWEEPFGRVVIEAISNGKPVIASSVGGITELGKYFHSLKLMDKNAFLTLDFDMFELDYSISDIDVIANKFSNRKITESYLNCFQDAMTRS